MVLMAKSSGFFGRYGGGLVVVLIAFSMLSVSIFAAIVPSPTEISLNWTNSGRKNITAGASPPSVVYVHNEMTGISGNYTQRGEYPYSNPTYAVKYWWVGNTPGCFSSLIALKDNPLAVRNGTGAFNNSNNMAASNLFTIIQNVTCPPGRYWGYFRLSNSSDQADPQMHENVTVTIDVPISTKNELSASTGVGGFKGKFLANSKGYQNFYFNTSNITGATGVEVTLGSLSQDIDLFLFDDSGNLKAKSINKGSASESLAYKYVPGGEVWEIRVFGNATSDDSYSGNLKFTTLNATNSTGQINVINFGTMGVGDNKTVTMTLKNEGGLTPSVSDSFEIYHIEYHSGSGDDNFSFVVPASATKVKASVNWTGSDNNTISLYKPSGSFVGNSSDKNFNARGADAGEYEEFVETTSISEGTWRAEIGSTGGSYTVVLKFWANPTSWISTNFTDGSISTNKSFYVRLDVPDSAMAKRYEGKLKYSGSLLEIPFSVNVSSPTLVLEDTLNSGSRTAVDNIGINRTGTDLGITVRLNNTGNEALTINNCPNSSGRLLHGSKRINFSFTCPSSVPAGSSVPVNIYFTVNTLETSNDDGIYTGWIFFNATDARPYKGFNLTLKVNLTNHIVVDLTDFYSGEWVNTSINQDVTMTFHFYYAKDSSTEVYPYLQHSNVSFWLLQPNTSRRIPSSGYLTKHNVSATMWESGQYKINVTIPSGQPGGWYRMYLSAVTQENGATLQGTGSKYPLFLNREGLELNPQRDPDLGAVEEDSDVILFKVNVVNYGPKKATGSLVMDDCSYATITANNRESGCGSQSGRTFTVDIEGNGTETCWYEWRITPDDDVDRNRTCNLDITYSGGYYGLVPVRLLVMDVAPTTTSGGGVAGAFCNDDDDCAATTYCEIAQGASTGACRALTCTVEQYVSDHRCVYYPPLVEILDYEQEIDIIIGENATTSVVVKNVGERSLSAELNVSVNDEITATTTPGWCSLNKDKNCTFTVNLIVSESAKLGAHSGTFKAVVRTNESSFFTQIFKVNVLADEEKKREIDTTFDGYEIIFQVIEREFEQLQALGILSEMSLSKAGVLINQTRGSVAGAKLAIGEGDYVEADSLIREINSSIDRLRREMDVLNEEKGRALEIGAGDIYLWVIIGVIIAAAVGLVIYMFMPTGGYRTGYGYRPSRKPPLGPRAGAGEKVKRALEDLVEKIKSIFKRKKSVGGDAFRYKFKK